jgi:REP element-mobilizing transposase RayT
MVHAYHVIFGMYGFWLPNDPRGSWSDFVRAWELRRFGPATKVTTRSSLANAPHDHALRLAAKQALQFPPVVLDDAQIASAARGFANSVEKSRLTIWACSILPEHVHLVIARCRYKVEQAVNLLKGEATKQLLTDNLHPLASHRDFRGRVPTPWAANCWKVFLNDEPHIDHAIAYVEDNPEKERPPRPRQHWPFVTPFTGLDTNVVRINV